MKVRNLYIDKTDAESIIHWSAIFFFPMIEMEIIKMKRIYAVHTLKFQFIVYFLIESFTFQVVYRFYINVQRALYFSTAIFDIIIW